MKSKEHPPQSAGDEPPIHVPVLLDTTLEALHPQPGESYLDLTVGYGGHARAVFERTQAYDSSVLVDRDAFALAHVDDLTAKGATAMHQDFLAAASALVQKQQTFDVIVADLGVSSPQLDKAERGFSFRQDGALDMRMSQSDAVTAATVVNTYSESELRRIIHQYGEEPWSTAGRIAQAIVNARPLERTTELADIIKHIIRGPKRHHPATRTFQALRIEVNQELQQIGTDAAFAEATQAWWTVGIISFHSLEDRIVKQYFKNKPTRDTKLNQS